MKVILLQEVQGLGVAGDIKNVSDGYAQNFLFSKQLALVATEANIDMISKRVKKKKEAKKTKKKNKKKK